MPGFHLLEGVEGKLHPKHHRSLDYTILYYMCIGVGYVLCRTNNSYVGRG